MLHTFLTGLALALAPLGARASETTVRLDVDRMAAPKPALRYQLLPEVRELNPGNPVHYYLRCFAEQRIFFFSKEAVAKRAQYRTMPLAELARENLRGYGGNALLQADWAARLDACDWLVTQRVQTEGMDLLLPELGPLQVLAQALQVRFRADAAGRNYDDAVRSAKTLFQLARHLGEHPTSAANLTGVGIADLAVDTLEEMLQQPGCPNLYWALADLPRPLVELRKGLQGDRAIVAADFKRLRDDAAMTDEQIKELIGHLNGRLGFAREQAGRPARSLRAELETRARDGACVTAARRRLAEAGLSLVRLLTLPPAQVILLDEKRSYEERRDEAMKLAALQPWQADALAEPAGDADGLFGDLVPHALEARRAQARLEQRLALLQHVEALRLHAAAHAGKLPPTLAEAGVPLPVDPFTGRPFAYELVGAVGHLRGSPVPVDGTVSALHYEITIRK